MAKSKKKQGRLLSSVPAVTRTLVASTPSSGTATSVEAVCSSVSEASPEPHVDAVSVAAATGRVVPVADEQPQDSAPSAVFAQSRWSRCLPDWAKVVLALAVIGVAAVIWYMPPLVLAGFPYVSYVFDGQRLNDAVLYRPLAMPTRYYIVLPTRLAGRYEWFAVDRRREVVALTEAPRHQILSRQAIKRSDPMGLDLEFRKLDGSEWQIHFFEDSIVFSNALLVVRLDTEKPETN